MIYTQNKTMQLIGYQHSELAILARADIRRVCQAHQSRPAISFTDLAIDAFILGTIYGRRSERAYRKRAEVKPIEYKADANGFTLTKEQAEYMRRFYENIEKRLSGNA